MIFLMYLCGHKPGDMFKFLRRLFWILLALTLVVFVVAIFLPSSIHVEETLLIKAPAGKIFPHINSLKAWEPWSPFQRDDIEMKSTYTGPDSGVGCTQRWKSIKNGDGNMRIVESIPYSYLKLDMDLMKKSEVVSEFRLGPAPEGTRVTWSCDMRDLPYPHGRFMGLFIPRMLKKFFTSGLQNLAEISTGDTLR